MPQEGRLGFGGYLSGEEAGLGFFPQGRRLECGLSLRGEAYIWGCPSGKDMAADCFVCILTMAYVNNSESNGKLLNIQTAFKKKLSD